MVSRRLVLLSMTAGAGLVGLGGVLWLRAPATGRLVLAPGEERIVASILLALFPADSPIGVDPIAAGAVDEVDRVLGEVLAPEATQAFRYLLRTLELGTLFSRGVPYSQLDPEVRLGVLQVWAGKDPLPRRVAMDSLKSVMGMAYFTRPAVQAAVGWRTFCPVNP